MLSRILFAISNISVPTVSQTLKHVHKVVVFLALGGRESELVIAPTYIAVKKLIKVKGEFLFFV